jgi:hypothetical protein
LISSGGHGGGIHEFGQIYTGYECAAALLGGFNLDHCNFRPWYSPLLAKWNGIRNGSTRAPVPAQELFRQAPEASAAAATGGVANSMKAIRVAIRVRI